MMRCPPELDIYRKRLNGALGDASNGLLWIPARRLTVMFSNGDEWEHVSVSTPDRCPTWAEMEFVKRAFFAPADCVMQLHVPVADHRNVHPFCLHLWRPLRVEIPRPPAYMVG